MEYKQLIHQPFSDRVQIEWDDTYTCATVYFLLEDETAVALSMSAATLKGLQEDIAAALDRKQQPIPNR